MSILPKLRRRKSEPFQYNPFLAQDSMFQQKTSLMPLFSHRTSSLKSVSDDKVALNPPKREAPREASKQRRKRKKKGNMSVVINPPVFSAEVREKIKAYSAHKSLSLDIKRAENYKEHGMSFCFNFSIQWY